MHQRSQRVGPCSRALPRALFIGAWLLFLSGCGALSVPVTDNESPTVSVRAVVRPQPGAGSERTGAGVEFGYEQYRAKDTRTLATGEVYSLGGVDVTGPDTLRQQATVSRAHVAWAHLIRFGPYFELEPFLGVARVNFRFKAEPVTSLLRPTINTSLTGVIGGVTPRWRFNEWLALELRITATNGSGMESFSTDAGLLLSPVPNLSLRLGYSEREQTFHDDFSFRKIEVNARGPSAQLQLQF